MTGAKDNSSLPLLLSLTGAVLLVAGGGWFFLDQEPILPIESTNSSFPFPTGSIANSETTEETKAEESDEAAEESAIEEESETAEDVVAEDLPNVPEDTDVEEATSTVEASDPPPEETGPDVDAELRKARLAADAELLVFPEEQSALHYYGNVLEADPQHEIAIAELDAVLSQVSQTVSSHVVAGEYDDAFRYVQTVARHRPEHALVVDTMQTLDDYTEQLVGEAIQQAQDGDDETAEQTLVLAEALPGRNPNYFTAVRDSIGEIQQVRLDAEEDRQRRVRLEEDDARVAWVVGVQGAIAAGNLITPAGASARDLLAEENSWEAERTQLNGEIVAALLNSTQTNIDAGSIDAAQTHLAAAIDLGGEAEDVRALQATLDTAIIDRESNRIVQMSEVVQTTSVVPRYPSRAEERGLSGWVNVLFTILPSGQTDNVEVTGSDPADVFVRAAVVAVEQWEFEPIEFRGQVISQRVATRLTFRLE